MDADGRAHRPPLRASRLHPRRFTVPAAGLSRGEVVSDLTRYSPYAEEARSAVSKHTLSVRLSFETPASPAPQDEVGGALEQRAWAAAASVVDPEVPVLTIADLGVLRDVSIAEDGAVEVSITPTYSGCPAMTVI